ncbi:hypothetical protein GCM10007971_25640 [Oceanobacillus indicireducens]|uniref:Uncharacterized protein n=1 Tax=Oceanobacillus indicireducens TaxID=1004261 RepID=A0A917Y1D1_9BACI|nr:hypothetical protein GCM10007971_25640 [Oceanobacillus indicireducens]
MSGWRLYSKTWIKCYSKEFNNILNKVKKTDEYKKLSKETIINELPKKDIVIHKEDYRVVVSFIIGERVGPTIWLILNYYMIWIKTQLKLINCSMVKKKIMD